MGPCHSRIHPRLENLLLKGRGPQKPQVKEDDVCSEGHRQLIFGGAVSFLLCSSPVPRSERHLHTRQQSCTHYGILSYFVRRRQFVIITLLFICLVYPAQTVPQSACSILIGP